MIFLQLPIRIFLGIIIVFFVPLQPIFSQIGGIATFEFVNLPVNARLVGLGGINVSSSDKDVSMFSINPALLTDSVDHFLAFNHYSYNAGVNNNQLNYARKISEKGMWGIALQQLSYGEFDSYDLTGQYLGTFNANDFSLGITHSRKIGVFSLGGTVKFVQSNIETYQASGLLFTLGGAFIHPEQDLKIGLVLQHFGFALSQYVDNQDYVMPFDARIGISYKPQKMPLRLSVTAHHLTEFLSIAYDNPNTPNELDAFGEEIDDEISFADKLSRHFVFGGEFVFSRNFNIRVAYNFLQRRELQVKQRKGLSGFSYGFMLRIKRFELAYSRAIQHISGGTNLFSLAIDTHRLIKKRRTIE
ncbi:MAG: type IX secretion system protein PorQ [Bacteroidota bacterium]